MSEITELPLREASRESGRECLLEASRVTKIYGRDIGRAAEMMRSGSDKSEVYRQTGCTVALWDVSFQVKKGEVFVIIGLSGSGKSTIIRCFNRLLEPTSGHVSVGGQQVESMTGKELLDFRRSKVSMVFQSFGLFTHRTVIENVAYGPEVRGISKTEREEKAMELIRMVGLEGWEHKSISSLSGGMKQRVGIARALANDPEVLLMDEPFSALDPLVRCDMQQELLSLQRKLGKTILFITHDIDEAFKLGDTIAIMRDGKIVQIDAPERMSTHPADGYVEQFIRSADKSLVLTARHVMRQPSCLIRQGDDMERAIRERRQEEFSSAYIVDGAGRLTGVLPLEDALQAMRFGLPVADMVVNEPLTTTEETLLSQLLPIVAEARYPVAVTDQAGTLKGIVSKASVLLSLV